MIYGLYLGIFIGTFVIWSPHLTLQFQELLILALGTVAMLTTEMLERIFPYNKTWSKDLSDRWSDFLLTAMLLPLVSKLVEQLYRMGLASVQLDIIYAWPVWAQYATVLLSCELVYYGIHRFSHQNPWLWRFHSYHHSVKKVTWLNSGRFHIVDMFVSMSGYYLPLFLLKLHPSVILCFFLTNIVTGLLEHANISYEGRPWGGLFNTAQYHRRHHQEQLAPASYGKILCLWDRIFGTLEKEYVQKSNSRPILQADPREPRGASPRDQSLC